MIYLDTNDLFLRLVQRSAETDGPIAIRKRRHVRFSSTNTQS